MRKVKNFNAENFRSACARSSLTMCENSGALQAEKVTFSSSLSVCENLAHRWQNLAESSKVSVKASTCWAKFAHAERTLLGLF